MEQLENRLKARRLQIRERLARKFGMAEIERIESFDPDDGGMLHIQLTCAQAAKYHRNYERLLSKMERQIAKAGL